MPIDKHGVAAELESSVETIEAYLDDGTGIVERYQDAFQRLPEEWTSEEIREELHRASYPGAYPTDEFDSASSLVVPHSESDGWENHEEINEWAREILNDVPVMAVDGSQLPPTTEFNVPLAYVQAAWAVNYHHADGRLERDVDGRLLTPDEITRESEDGDYRFVDSQLVGHHRFEYEGSLLIEQLVELAAARDAGDIDHTPIVFYDGPLIASFANPLKPETRERYISTLSRVIAASQHHEIPLVGYIAGSSATELVKMTRLLLQDEFETDRVIPDAHVLTELMSPWGDTTIPFISKRDGSIDALQTTYEGEQYEFRDDILFSYLNVPPGAGLDRIEFPGWLCRRDGPDGYDSMYEYTVEIVRAEAGVGRGYPEILQQADSDAVLDHQDRQQFHRIVQRWADSNDVPLGWNAKALSKELRRR
ncbi:DNA double-strand break repair nuclease NurA [Natronobacterium gregoryi]|uniref:NurA domain-containing protein n=2 Tax=Natronobacterium gregoryi TaxID=44930 RepID=L0AJ00_NATGS|nr:DNA double-strand break repair nuclease NurA [Natronobacterium gregoryi]AFZ73776.1 NurA domain-containing protein [Natronobacterium gregoryi SP2]ELY65670.1 NurA domain-containing protein [Natronobacterium gregoryi SP2]PLK18729.1 NurA domain-containing protein [Natronobacterium gregoryi SP2]SFJ65850.1 NurA domain-containing protein [Natronobacterium gregoryi]